MAMLTCMIKSEMSCEIEGVQLRTYVSEFTAADILVGNWYQVSIYHNVVHKAMRDLNGANLSGTARLSFISG